ncbi:sulfite reductase subunit alpha [Stella sp.]|uniref:sulfite reductase subunit alpha n=1 Tax=Stella sp. TaxID=2912054 RepID=UPI0035ADCBC8
MALAELLPADPDRLLAAAAVAVGYVGLCGGTALGRLRKRAPATPAGMAAAGDVTVAFASQTGLAEQLAARTLAFVAASGATVRLVPLAALDRAALERGGRLLLVLSTTGEGDAPDAAAGFARRVLGGTADLSRLRYGLLALGDRDYRHFCAFGLAVAQWLDRNGAHPIFPPMTVDDGDPEALARWQTALAAAGLGEDAAAPDWTEEPPFGTWRLAERRPLNPDDAEHPAFHLAFVAEDGAAEWQAGDLARIRIPGEPECHRDYSIASIPAEGRLTLLVRLARRPDGTVGRGSGWLAEGLADGGTVRLQIRRNPGFHAPAGDPPLVLIGSGTGLAGLRAHLAARAACGIGGAWLLFGERRRAADWFHREDIEGWIRSGVIDRLDLAFSRDQAERVYVQHRLRAAAADLVRRIDEGAAILVCGSAAGMAPAVHAVLEDALGRDRLERLAEAGRYRRDVY